MSEQKDEIVIYRTRDGKTALEVTLEEQTVWLMQAQMAKLFERGERLLLNTFATFLKKRS